MAVNKDFPGTLVKPKGRNVWVYQIYMPGRNVFKRSTGKTNYQAAVAEARKLYQQALLLSASPDASLEDLQPKLGKAVVQEVKRIEDLGNPDRAQRVSYCLENFYNWAGNIPLDKITTDMLARYQVFRSTCKKKINVGKDRKTRKDAKDGRPISTSTIVMEVQYAIRMLKNNGFTVAKPKPPKKREAHAGRPFTPEELKRFFEACNAYPNEDPGRYTPLFMLMLSAGARPAELVPSDRSGHVALLKKEIDYKRGIVEIRSAKVKPGESGSRTRLRVPLHILEMVRKTAEINPGPHVFAPMIIKNVFNRILKKAGLEQVDELGEKLTAHSLRHTYGTALAKAGVSSFVIQNLMRHTDPRTTAKYTKRAIQGGMIIDPLNMLNGQKDEEEDKGENGLTDSKAA